MSQIDLSYTLFPEWVPPSYPKWINGMSAGEKSFFASRIHLMSKSIRDAERDGLSQIIPVIAATGMPPNQIRKEVGKSVWRKIHHASLTSNARRARIWHSNWPRVAWQDITTLRPCHLSHVVRTRNSRHWHAVMFAGTKADQGSFQNVFMLFVDCQRMGVEPSPKWSVKRLHREHDALALKKAMAQHSPSRWATPFAFEHNGFRFDRLISDLDLAQEGFTQKHCVASYTRLAKSGQRVFMRITGQERATYAFDLKDQYSELKSYRNGTTSRACKVAAKAAQAAYRETLKTRTDR